MSKKTKETEVVKVHAGELGNLLQQYRESIGFSVTQTADALCLSEKTITHLENEEFESLAEPPYIRGYLRNYAKLVEQEPSELISLYEKLRGASPNELEHHFKPSPSARKKSPWLPIIVQLLFVGLIIAGLVALASIPNVRAWFTNTWQSFSQQSNDNSNGILENNNPLLTGNMPAPLPISGEQNQPTGNTPVTKTNKANDNKASHTSNKSTSIPPLPSDIFPETKIDIQKKNKSSEEKQASPKQLSKKEDASPQDTHSKSASDTVKIKLVFNKEVWLRIKNKDKKTVYEGQTSAGNEKELELKKPLSFRIGNAQGISIFVDGKPKDITQYIKGSVASFTVQ